MSPRSRSFALLAVAAVACAACSSSKDAGATAASVSCNLGATCSGNTFCIRGSCTPSETCVVEKDVGALVRPVLGEIEVVVTGGANIFSPMFLVRLDRNAEGPKGAFHNMIGHELSTLGSEMQVQVEVDGASRENGTESPFRVSVDPSGLMVDPSVGGSVAITHRVIVRVFVQLENRTTGIPCPTPLETTSVSIAYTEGSWKVTKDVP